MNDYIELATEMGFVVVQYTEEVNLPPGITMTSFLTRQVKEHPLILDLIYRDDTLVTVNRKWHSRIDVLGPDADILSLLNEHREYLDEEDIRPHLDKLRL